MRSRRCAHDFVGSQENVACAGLGEDMGLAAARVHDLDDVESARAANRFRNLAARQVRHDVRKQGRELARPAPAQVAALQGLLPVGMNDCGFGKIEPGAQLCKQRQRFFTGFADFLWRRSFRYRDEDVSQPILAVAATLLLHRRQIIVDVAGRYRDAVADESLLHPRHEQFAPDFLAKFREVVAVSLHDFAKVGGAEAVPRRELVHRTVQFIVFDAQVVFIRELELNAIDDETFEHLTGEHVVGRNRCTRLLQSAADQIHANAQLALHDDIVVDDGDDAVEIDDPLGRGGEGKEEAREHRDEEGEAGRKRPEAGPERNHGSEGVLVP